MSSSSPPPSESAPRLRFRRKRGSSGNYDDEDDPLFSLPSRGNFSTKGLLQLETPANFDILSFVAFLGKRRAVVIPQEDLKLQNPGLQDLQGSSMLVQRSSWKGQDVVIKRSRAFLDGSRRTSSSTSSSWYENFMNDLIFEIQIMFHEPLCSHRNIVKLLGISFEPVADGMGDLLSEAFIIPMLVMEPADSSSPDLGLFLSGDRKLDFETAADISAGIADGLTELHAYGVVHADLKPENILMYRDSGTPSGFIPKLADFGFSGISPLKQHPRGGTQMWNAPECLRNCGDAKLRKYSNSFTRDIYSFGMIALFIALDGNYPFSPYDTSIKLSDSAAEQSIASLKGFRNYNDPDSCLSDWPTFETISRETLRLNPLARARNLSYVRPLLTGTHFVTPEEILEQPKLALQNLTKDRESSHDIIHIYSSLPQHIKSHLGKHLETELSRANLSENYNVVPSALGHLLAEDGFISRLIVDKAAEMSLKKYVDILPSQGTEILLNTRKETVLMQGLPSDSPSIEELSDNDDPVSVAIRGNSVIGLKRYFKSPSFTDHGPKYLQRTTSEGWSYLHIVAATGADNFITVLIEAGLDPNSIAGPRRHTPLHEAARGGHEECVRRLLHHGADVDGCAFQPLGPEYTPLALTVALAGAEGLELSVCETLLQNGARFQGYVYDESVIHRSIRSPVLMRSLLERWPELVDVRDQCHQTPLEVCSMMLELEAARVLVEYGADINTKDKQNRTPLHNLFTLVQGVADLSFFAEFARNMEFEYCVDKHREMIRLLLDHGADVDVESDRPVGAHFPGQSLTPESAMWNDSLYESELDITAEEANLTPNSAWILEKASGGVVYAYLQPSLQPASISKVIPSMFPHYYDIVVSMGRFDCLKGQNPSLELTVTMLKPNLARNERRIILKERFNCMSLFPVNGVKYTKYISQFHLGHMAPILIEISIADRDIPCGGLFIECLRIRRSKRPHDFALGEDIITLDANSNLPEVLSQEPRFFESSPKDGTGFELPWPEDLDLLQLLFPPEPEQPPEPYPE